MSVPRTWAAYGRLVVLAAIALGAVWVWRTDRQDVREAQQLARIFRHLDALVAREERRRPPPQLVGRVEDCAGCLCITSNGQRASDNLGQDNGWAVAR